MSYTKIMSMFSNKFFFVSLIILLIIIAVILFQIIYIVVHGKTVSTPIIPRETQTLGTATDTVIYTVLGDSTSIGQGTTYDKSIARKTAEFLAMNHTVKLTNFGISGALVKDVLTKEVARAATLKPDIVLLAIGANDITHLTKLSTIKHDLIAIIRTLQSSNPHVRIILTGVPQMGSIPRFPWPTNLIARYRTEQVNKVMKQVVTLTNVEFASIAEKTGPIFDKRPDLFAQDNFHPTGDGYAVWLPVLMPFFER
jgi:acyl-CoA thioesterase-1